MKLLFLSAHPDDLEFYVGYILYALGRNNKKGRGKEFISRDYPIKQITIQIASMTRGEMSDLTTTVGSSKEAAHIRTQELINALAVLGCPPPTFLGLFDGFVSVNAQTIERTKNYLQKTKPDFVIAPEPVFTWYNHRDHLNTGKLVYYAIQKWHSESPTDPKPKIYYYTALFNHYFFPRFDEWDSTRNASLLEHKSQQGILTQGKIPDFLTKFLAGFHIRGFSKAQPLRRQYSPNIDPLHYRKKLLKNWTLEKRIFYYIVKKLLGYIGNIDYSDKYKYVDGTITSSEFPPIIPDINPLEEIKKGKKNK